MTEIKEIELKTFPIGVVHDVKDNAHPIYAVENCYYDLEEIAKLSTQTHLCTSTFSGKDEKDGLYRRVISNNPNINWMFFDIDGDVDDDGNIITHTNKEVYDAFISLNCPFIITTSKSHNKDKLVKGKLINCPRFHIMIPLLKPYNNAQLTNEILNTICERINIRIDQNCKDGVRYFNPGIKSWFFNINKPLLDITNDLINISKYYDIVNEEKELKNIEQYQKKLERDEQRKTQNIVPLTNSEISTVQQILLNELESSISGMNGNNCLWKSVKKIIKYHGNMSNVEMYNYQKCYPRWDNKTLTLLYEKELKKFYSAGSNYVNENIMRLIIKHKTLNIKGKKLHEL